MSAFTDWFTGRSTAPTETRDLAQVMWDMVTAQTLGVDQALQLPAVFSSVSMVADTVGTLQMKVYELDGDQVPIQQPQPSLLDDSPQPGVTTKDWYSEIAWSMLTTGNAFIWLRNIQQGRPTEGWVLDPAEVTLTWNESKTQPVIAWRNQRMIQGQNVLHIRLNPRAGQLGGLSPIEAGLEALQTMKAVQDYLQLLMQTGAVPTGTLTFPYELEADEAGRFKAQFVEGQKSPSPAILSGGITYDGNAFSPLDAQVGEQLQFGVLEVARLFKIPAPLLQAAMGSGSAVVYQNEGTLVRQFLTNAVQPILNAIEESITLVLAPGLFARFDMDELMRPNYRERYEANQIALDSGWLTVDEVRKQEGLAPIPVEARQIKTVEVVE